VLLLNFFVIRDSQQQAYEHLAASEEAKSQIICCADIMLDVGVVVEVHVSVAVIGFYFGCGHVTVGM
jgi:hypothetical protein